MNTIVDIVNYYLYHVPTMNRLEKFELRRLYPQVLEQDGNIPTLLRPVGHDVDQEEPERKLILRSKVDDGCQLLIVQVM